MFYGARMHLRRLFSRPILSVASIATLALAAGAGSAVFAVANATVFRPLPYPDAGQLVRVFEQPPQAPGFQNRNGLSLITLLRFQERSRSLRALEGIWGRARALGWNGDPETVPSGDTTAGFFALLGAQPLLGRTFTAEEERANRRVVVLGYSLWRRRFNQDRGIIGRSVTIDREPHEVIGVMRADFEPAFVASELWTPLDPNENTTPLGFSNFIAAVGRLRDGASVDAASAEAAAMMHALGREYPRSHAGWSAFATDLTTGTFGGQRPAVAMLGLAALLLGLIGVANIAHLTLADVASRRGEIALRTALGADRWDLLRLHAADSLVIGVCGGGLALLIAWMTAPMLMALDPTAVTAVADTRIDLRVTVAGAVLALVLSFVSRAVPAWSASRIDVLPQLASAARGSISSQTSKFGLVAGESALAVVLLVGGFVLVNALDRSLRTDPGFDPRNVVVMQLRIAESTYGSTAARASYVERLLERIRRVPGIVSAAAGTGVLGPGNSTTTQIVVEGQPTPDGQAYGVQFRRVSAGYFSTLRVPVLAGREVSRTDGIDAPPAAVVSESMANRFWPTGGALGRRVRRTGADTRWYTIVGVVADVRDASLAVAGTPTLYMPYSQNNTGIVPVTISVRAQTSPLGVVRAVRQAIAEIDALQPVDRIAPLTEFLADSLGSQRFRSVLLGSFAVLGLALAVVGIYGVTARGVQERTREVAIRIALGADARTAWWTAMRRSIAAVGGGVIAGALFATLGADRVFRALGVVDPATLPAVVGSATALLTTATIAAAWPARRAIAINPVEALRSE